MILSASKDVLCVITGLLIKAKTLLKMEKYYVSPKNDLSRKNLLSSKAVLGIFSFRSRWKWYACQLFIKYLIQHGAWFA